MKNINLNLINKNCASNKPLFFLFTCVKEGRQYITKLFDSLLSQTKINFVHYIYEDGSDKPLDEIVEQYKEEVSKLSTPYKVIYEKNPVNIGLNMATKHCIDMCYCPYFIWIDCDNWIDAHFFEELEKTVKKNKNSIIVRTKCLRSKSNKRVEKTFAFKHRHNKNQCKLFLYGSFCYGFFAVKNDIYKKINKENFFFDKRDYFNDDQIIALSLLSGCKVSFCDKAIGFFLVHDGNESLLFHNDDIFNEYQNYSLTSKTFSVYNSAKLLHIYKLRVSYSSMEKHLLNDNKESWRIYFERLNFARKNKIENKFIFKTGNRFSWFFKLLFFSLAAAIKRLFIIIHKILTKLKINQRWLLFNAFYPKPNVMSDVETINMILNNGMSIARFGDGEFRLMTRTGYIQFQSPNFHLSDELIRCFNMRNEKLLICSYNFSKKRPMNNEYGKWLKRFVYKHYKPLISYFDNNYKYGDTDITRFYHPYLYKMYDFNYLLNEYIPLIKRLWENRNLLIVEGEQTKLGIGNDLFDNAKTIRRIVCPSKNAFNQYKEIYAEIVKNYRNNDLIVLALGPTATVLAANLTVEKKYQCLDLGHIDVVYFWFLNKSKKLDFISGKYVNEAESDSIIDCSTSDNLYLNQVVSHVTCSDEEGKS